LTGYEALARAIVDQAMLDRWASDEELRKEAGAFLESEAGQWLAVLRLAR